MDKYSVDRIEEDTIVLENIENKEIIEINKSELDFEVVDGNILKLVDGKYVEVKPGEEGYESAIWYTKGDNNQEQDMQAVQM